MSRESLVWRVSGKHVDCLVCLVYIVTGDTQLFIGETCLVQRAPETPSPLKACSGAGGARVDLIIVALLSRH